MRRALSVLRLQTQAQHQQSACLLHFKGREMLIFRLHASKYITLEAALPLLRCLPSETSKNSQTSTFISFRCHATAPTQPAPDLGRLFHPTLFITGSSARPSCAAFSTAPPSLVLSFPSPPPPSAAPPGALSRHYQAHVHSRSHWSSSYYYTQSMSRAWWCTQGSKYPGGAVVSWPSDDRIFLTPHPPTQRSPASSGPQRSPSSATAVKTPAWRSRRRSWDLDTVRDEVKPRRLHTTMFIKTCSKQEQRQEQQQQMLEEKEGLGEQRKKGLVVAETEVEAKLGGGEDVRYSAGLKAVRKAEREQVGRGRAVVVGISGGVDSAVTALLLKNQGYQVSGVYMSNWDSKEETGGWGCESALHLQDAREVCQHLGIPLREVSFVREYWHQVFTPFLAEVARGLTPNPDLACNRYIKFRMLLQYSKDVGADYMATGHYARIQHIVLPSKEEKLQLLQGVDPIRDQTYFLAAVSCEALQSVLFPLGGLHKDQVRALAQEAGLLKVSKKKSSNGICFIGRRSFADFIAEYIECKGGDFVDVASGQVKGQHRGLAAYTCGQRAGLSGEVNKWYVVGKDVVSNTVVVAEGPEHPALFCNRAVVGDLFWVAGHPPRGLDQGQWMRVKFKSRSLQDEAECLIQLIPHPTGDEESQSDTTTTTTTTTNTTTTTGSSAFLGPLPLQGTPPFTPSGLWRLAGEDGCWTHTSGDILRVSFLKPLRAVTPRQAFVVYDDEVCLGGGLVQYPCSSLFEQGLSSEGTC